MFIESREEFKNKLVEDIEEKGYEVEFGDTEIGEDPNTGLSVEWESAKVLSENEEVTFRLNTNDFSVNEDKYGRIVSQFFKRIQEKI